MIHSGFPCYISEIHYFHWLQYFFIIYLYQSLFLWHTLEWLLLLLYIYLAVKCKTIIAPSKHFLILVFEHSLIIADCYLGLERRKLNHEKVEGDITISEEIIGEEGIWSNPENGSDLELAWARLLNLKWNGPTLHWKRREEPDCYHTRQMLITVLQSYVCLWYIVSKANERAIAD